MKQHSFPAYPVRAPHVSARSHQGHQKRRAAPFIRLRHAGEQQWGKSVSLVSSAGRKEGGVLDRPVTVPLPSITPHGDRRRQRQKKKPRSYKVMLHNDAVNRREYVVRVLLRVVKALTVDSAVNVMQLAHQYGLACVISCAQEEAEKYCEGLRSNGLISTVEPAGTDSNDGGEPST